MQWVFSLMYFIRPLERLRQTVPRSAPFGRLGTGSRTVPVPPRWRSGTRNGGALGLVAGLGIAAPLNTASSSSVSSGSMRAKAAVWALALTNFTLSRCRSFTGRLASATRWQRTCISYTQSPIKAKFSGLSCRGSVFNTSILAPYGMYSNSISYRLTISPSWIPRCRSASNTPLFSSTRCMYCSAS